VLKKTWMTKESVMTIKVLRSCFVKLSNAIGTVNNTFDHFWLLDTLQNTVSVVSTIAQIAQSPEKLSGNTFMQLVLASITVMRLLLLAILCGDVSDEVNLQLGLSRFLLFFTLLQASKVNESLAVYLENTSVEEEQKEVWDIKYV
jgi:hypothetical protein